MFFYANKEHGLGTVQVVKRTCQTYFSKLNPIRQAGEGAGRGQGRGGQEEKALQRIGLRAVCPMTGPPKCFSLSVFPKGRTGTHSFLNFPAPNSVSDSVGVLRRHQLKGLFEKCVTLELCCKDGSPRYDPCPRAKDAVVPFTSKMDFGQN